MSVQDATGFAERLTSGGSLAGSPTFLGLAKPQLFTLMFVLMISNALLPTIIISIENYGFLNGILNTFDISAVVWAGIAIGVSQAWEIEADEFSLTEKGLVLFGLVACFLPLGPATWAVLSFVALATYFTTRDRGSVKAGSSWIFFAVSIPMFWSKQLFNMFSELMLSFDAFLVAGVTRTERTGNLVAMPGGNGYLEIHPLCSSISNLSTAVLCWMLFSRVNKLRFSYRNILWCLVACGAVVLINLIRISLIGYFPEHYGFIHGPTGRAIASWTTIGFVIYACVLGVRREKARLV